MIPRLRWAATCLVFVVLPMLIVRDTANVQVAHSDAAALDRCFSRLERTLFAVAGPRDTETFLAHLLNRVYRLSVTRRASAARLAAFLHRRFPGLLELYFLDRDGEVLPTASAPLPPRRILSTLFTAVNREREGRGSAPLPADWARVMTFLGPGARWANLIQHHARVFQVGFGDRRRWLFYRTNVGGGLVAHIHRTPGFEDLGLTQRVLMHRRIQRNPIMQVGLHSTAWPGPSPTMGDSAALPPHWRRETPVSRGATGPSWPVTAALKRFAVDRNPWQRSHGQLVALLPVSPTQTLWATYPELRVIDPTWTRMRIDAVLAGCTLLLCCFVWMRMVRGAERPFSIRYLLLALFAYASLLPLSLLLVSGWRYLDEAYERRVQQHHDRAIRVLESIDAGFPRFRSRLETMVRRAFAPIDAARQGAVPHRRRLEAFAERWLPESLVVFDRRGRSLFGLPPGDKLRRRRRMEMSGQIVEGMLARLNHEPPSSRDTWRDGLLETMGGEEAFNYLLGNLSRICDFRFGAKAAWTYVHPLPVTDTTYAQLAVVHWRQEEMATSYLESRLQAIAAHRRWPVLCAAHPDGDWRHPADPALHTYLAPFASQLRRSHGGQIRTRVYRGGRAWLLSASRPERLAGFLLFSLMPERPLQTAMGRVRRRAWGLALVTVAASAFLSSILARRFLTPIAALAAGIQSIGRKDFTVRLAVGQADELGELTALFNRMAGNLGELDLAAAVQHRLLPPGPLQAGDYRVVGATRPAAELGGDYFDHLVFADRYLVVIVADVTGHGAAAALAMAMAKSVVAVGSRQQWDWSVLLDQLDQAFHASFRGEILLPVSMLWYDLVDHSGVVVSCGHPSPCSRRAAATDWVKEEAFGPPLGLARRRLAGPRAIRLAPGDELLFFTDGMLEGIPVAPDESQIDRFLTFLGTVGPDSGADRLASIFAAHRQRFGIVRQPDDYTLVLVRREGSRLPAEARDRS